MTREQLEQARTDLIAQLRAHADPIRAAGEKKYLRSELNFHGVKVPQIKAILKTWLKTQPPLTSGDLGELAGALWASDWHEERSLAVFLLEERPRLLMLDHLPLIETMMREVNTWAHLDEIAIHVVGVLLERHSDEMRPHLLRWAVDANFWVRRVPVLAQNAQFRKGGGDFPLFEQIAAPMLDEGKAWSKDERFFIRKAIGWALREMCKHHPEWVVDFVGRHGARMSGLTLREATRKLLKEGRARLGID
jgi:3-methyladenine DNA glycosylase AlkD